MLDILKNLLALQECDRKLMRVREELGRIGPERQTVLTQSVGAQTALETARHQAMQIESDRKKLELDVDAQKQLIDKYSLQQFQTRKNEEYRALSHEIETCKGNISQIEDKILEFMEQADLALKTIQQCDRQAQEMKKLSDERVAELAKRESVLRLELASLESKRLELVAKVPETPRLRYERLLKSKGSNVVVGIQHGVCGGCHMSLQRQVVVSCQAEQDVVACSNCGRMLYFTPDMDTTLVD